MTPEERKEVESLTKDWDPKFKSAMLELIESKFRLQSRLEAITSSVITPKGMIIAIEDAQHAAQDFMTAAQNTNAVLGEMRKKKGGS